MRTRDIKARAEELIEGYQEARDEEFSNEFKDYVLDYLKLGHPAHNLKNIITEDDIQGFMDSFTFEDEWDWAYTQVQNELDDIGDAKYQQMKDER